MYFKDFIKLKEEDGGMVGFGWKPERAPSDGQAHKDQLKSTAGARPSSGDAGGGGGAPGGMFMKKKMKKKMKKN